MSNGLNVSEYKASVKEEEHKKWEEKVAVLEFLKKHRNEAFTLDELRKHGLVCRKSYYDFPSLYLARVKKDAIMHYYYDHKAKEEDERNKIQEGKMNIVAVVVGCSFIALLIGILIYIKI